MKMFINDDLRKLSVIDIIFESAPESHSDYYCVVSIMYC